MRVKILGCSGGIGGNLRTTAMLVDHDILIDAGTGVSELDLAELKLIDHVFVTHSHLDHITSIPFLVDTVGHMRDKPLTVHATPETTLALKQHIFNWQIWPDFTAIPNKRHPFLRYESIKVGKTVDMGGRKITPLPANHVVPAVGFHLDSGRASLVFSGDTTTNDALWERVNKIENLRYLIIETAFSDSGMDIAIASKHLCPSLLAAELAKLKRPAEIYITHLKPGEINQTMVEIEALSLESQPRMLQNFKFFQF
ncbi:MAG: MBL fold metallo-hydrolase [Burkholderiales bacterium]